MEPRHYIAYGLLLAIALVGGVTGTVYARRRAARKRRLRGIKTYPSAGKSVVR